MEHLLQWKMELELELGRNLNENEMKFLTWIYGHYVSEMQLTNTRIHENIKTKLLSYGFFKGASCSSF